MSNRNLGFLYSVLVLAVVAGPGASYQEEETTVEPVELARRPELVGKRVVVDDHVRYYVRRPEKEPDELQLRRTNVTFLVPGKLPWDSKPVAAIVHGVLRRDGARLVCEVTEVRAMGGDLERLENGVKGLSVRDAETRAQWARWALRRAGEFKDEALLKRAREVEAEAFRIETSTKRLGVDAPSEWLAMAKDARKRQVPEPEPSALAHRALRAKLKAAADVADVEAVVQEIEKFFPAAANDARAARTNVARWDELYAKDPAPAYRAASENARKALDRRLWADATERLMEAQPTGDLAAALAKAERATTMLPEKTELAKRLVEKAVGEAKRNLATLRQPELKELTDVLRTKLKQPEDAVAVTRQWLEIRKNRLSDTDAQAALSLALQYEEMLGDTVTTVELLRKAWRIDPKSKEVAEALGSRNFRKVGNEWVESAPAGEGAGREGRPEPGRSKGLLGMTPEEVLQRMAGKPSQVCYLGSQGQSIEQWIYLDTQGARYVNLLHSPGETKPRVVAFYTLPLKVKGGLGQSR